ncbi:hypothetical protein PTTG_27688 [Puccinia triticina 1-1 BBBD Race 1]|uniref:Uncharacterized protein n=1 Tax=Puccinia triticina (isolate 1-1 / race 1 (BBBD)) TaxID=630390 RepID=A0A180GIN7_PUCT1|nr:hypothetical protein PTTG_27688 [Puccinia triticina 1-1 BBBD Race 1]
MQFLTLTVLTFLAAALGPIQVSCACDDGYPVSWCLTYREEPGGPQPLAKDCKLHGVPRSGRCNKPADPWELERLCCDWSIQPDPKDGSIDCGRATADGECRVDNGH